VQASRKATTGVDLQLGGAGRKFTGRWSNGDRDGGWLGDREREVMEEHGLFSKPNKHRREG
jgi:hypothetical protein